MLVRIFPAWTPAMMNLKPLRSSVTPKPPWVSAPTSKWFHPERSPWSGLVSPAAVAWAEAKRVADSRRVRITVAPMRCKVPDHSLAPGKISLQKKAADKRRPLGLAAVLDYCAPTVASSKSKLE